MIVQQNKLYWLKFNALCRYILAHGFSNILPLYIINEYPKSGGSWISNIFSELLGVPFPRNRLPVLKSSILHCHKMQSWNLKNVFIVWRDGRDVLVSLYFHLLYENDRFNQRAVFKTRSDLNFKNYNDVKKNMSKFIEYIYYKKNFLNFTWSDFVNQWVDRKEVIYIKYEDMLDNPFLVVRNILDKNFNKNISDEEIKKILNKYSFDNQSGRSYGVENKNSFLRKGISGDWKNYFSSDACKLCTELMGKELIKLNYENDNNWADQFLKGQIENKVS